jgi:hypothetical protein
MALELSNAAKVRMISRIVVALMNRLGEDEMRLEMSELEDLRAFGMAYDNGSVLLALGDPPASPTKGSG